MQKFPKHNDTYKLNHEVDVGDDTAHPVLAFSSTFWQ